MPVYQGPGGSALERTTVARVPSKPAEVSGLRTLEDVDPIGRTEVLIYGPPKSGKTVLASTFPGPFRWIAADGETSLKSVRWAFKESKTSIKDMKDLVFYVPQEDYTKGGYPEKAKAFNRMTDMIDYWFGAEEVDKWQTLVVDSVTELMEWALNLGLDLNMQLPNKNKPLSKSHETNLVAKARVLTGQQDYKSAMALLEGWLSDVRVECAKHHKNLVILCHEWTETGEGSTGEEIVLRYRPLLIGQQRERIPKSFDDVWHMTVYNGSEYKVQVHEGPKVIAGTRWGQCLSREEPADYKVLIDKVRKYHGL